MEDEKIGKNIQFSEGTANRIAEQILNPDANGFSKEVSIEKFENEGLTTDNGLPWCRTGMGICAKYNIHKKRLGKVKVIALQALGFNTELSTRSNIPVEVRRKLSRQSCVVLGTSKVEIDHKDGYGSTGTLIDDFQPLSRSVNIVKREDCKKCRNTGKRFDARSMNYSVGWIFGDENWNDSIKCKGCFWNDVKQFRQSLKLLDTSSKMP